MTSMASLRMDVVVPKEVTSHLWDAVGAFPRETRVTRATRAHKNNTWIHICVFSPDPRVLEISMIFPV